MREAIIMSPIITVLLRLKFKSIKFVTSCGWSTLSMLSRVLYLSPPHKKKQNSFSPWYFFPRFHQLVSTSESASPFTREIFFDCQYLFHLILNTVIITYVLNRKSNLECQLFQCCFILNSFNVTNSKTNLYLVDKYYYNNKINGKKLIKCTQACWWVEWAWW